MKKKFPGFQIIIDDMCENIEIDQMGFNEDGKYSVLDRVQFTRYDLIQSFLNYGGSFVQSLGNCLTNADHINARKIIDAFQSYVIEYAFQFIKK